MAKRKWPKPATSHRGDGGPVVIISNHDEGKSVADTISDQAEQAREAQIKHMVQRFLSWRLPDNFNPDGGVRFEREINGARRPHEWWPSGTNVFDAVQAEAMVRHMIEGLPGDGSKQPQVDGES